VEVTLWDYTGDITRLEAVDSNGAAVPLQVVDAQPQRYWDHLFYRALFEAEVPAFGWATYELRPKKMTDYPTYRNTLEVERIETPNEAFVLENEHLCARFDTGSGMLHSLVDKASGKELLGAPAGLQLVRTNNGGMTAWLVGRYLGMEPVTGTTHVTHSKGALRSSVTFTQSVMHSTVKLTVSLDAGAKALHYAMEIDWHETGKGQEWLPVLVYRLPVAGGVEKMLNDIPAGAAVRTPAEIERPALSYACPAVDGVTAALVCDCKYGYRLTPEAISCTLINTGMDPDPYPERGIHHINLYLTLTEAAPAALKVAAEQLIRPMAGVPTAVHAGTLPAEGSLLGADTGSCVITAVTSTEDGALAVRCYETEGKPATVRLYPPFTAARAALVDLNETELAPAAVEDGVVSAAVAPYSIAEIKIWKE
jgi:alpha-mannosidase